MAGYLLSDPIPYIVSDTWNLPQEADDTAATWWPFSAPEAAGSAHCLGWPEEAPGNIVPTEGKPRQHQITEWHYCEFGVDKDWRVARVEDEINYVVDLLEKAGGGRRGHSTGPKPSKVLWPK